MKRLCFLLLLVVFVFALVSCRDEPLRNPESKADSDSGSGVVDPASPTDPATDPSEDPSGGKEVIKVDLSIPENIREWKVSSDALLQIEGLDYSDGVVIIDGDFIGTKALGDEASGSDGVFKREDGTFIPVPDANSVSRFLGSDLGILGLSTIRFKKLKLDDDFSISSKEYPGRTGAQEEFYYLNFLQEKWRHLDRSEIVFWFHGVGHKGVSLLHWSLHNKPYSIDGVFDFSGPEYSTGIGIDMFAVLDAASFEEKDFHLYVMNPVKLEAGSNVEVDDPVTIFKVPAQSSGAHYKAVVKFSPDDYSRLDYTSFHTRARYLDGTSRDDELIPFFDDSSYTVELEMGAVDEDFIFTIDLTYRDVSQFSGATIELVESCRTEVYRELKPGEVDGFFSYDGSSLVQTFAFKSNDEWHARISWMPKVKYVSEFLTGVHGYGTGGSFPEEDVTFKEGYNYCYMVRLSEPCPAGEKLGEIKPRDLLELKCDVELNENYDYECPGCENCDGKGFVLRQSDINANNILEGDFRTVNPVNSKYGRVCYRNGYMVLTESKTIRLDSTTTGNLGMGAYGTRSWNNDNKKESIDIRVKEIRPSAKEIVVDMVIDEDLKGEKLVMENIVMKNEHWRHSWKVRDDESVVCTVCNEVRYSSSMKVKGGTWYIVDSNDDFSIWVENEPDTEFQMKMGRSNAPYVPYDMDVRFIASAPDKRITHDIVTETYVKINVQ